jgi:hypothetical protein
MIVGSAALNYNGLYLREPKDIDVWISDQDIAATQFDYPRRDGDYEYHVIPEKLYQLIPKDKVNVATPDAIYTIKCSHAGWDIHWHKTMSDIMALRKLGCKKIPELYDALYKYWLTHHDNKKYLSLNKTKEEFFTDYVDYKVDHDRLHEIVAFYDKPIYTKVLKENCEVLIDKLKFDKLSQDEKLHLFLEEICVIALERWVIPAKFDFPKQKAYNLALKKTITSLTKNWATEFLVDNYEFYAKNSKWGWYNKAEEWYNANY